MISSFKTYAIGVLVILVLLFGGMSCSLKDKNASLNKEVITLTAEVNKAEKDLADAHKACLVTETIINDVSVSNNELSSAKGKDLEDLAKAPHETLLETIKDASKTSKPASKYADDARLSPDTMRLLNNAYCKGAKDDPACTAK